MQNVVSISFIVLALAAIVYSMFRRLGSSGTNKAATNHFEEPPVMSEVLIAGNTWMTCNLDVAIFRTGEPILNAQTDEQWKQAMEAKQAAWCYYDNADSNGMEFGRLYNWYAVTDPRGLAPQGWVIPSDKEWKQFTEVLGGADKAGIMLKSRLGWLGGKGGKNSVGFFGLPGGCREANGEFADKGVNGYWWSSSEHTAFNGWYRSLYGSEKGMNRGSSVKGRGYSVRCLRG